MAPFLHGGKGGLLIPFKGGETLVFKDETKPLSWISHEYLQRGRCLDLPCSLQSTSREFLHREPLAHLVASPARVALTLPETGQFSAFYGCHSSQVLKLNPPLPHHQPSVSVRPRCQECGGINTLTLQCNTGLKIPLEQEEHILTCAAVASLWSSMS